MKSIKTFLTGIFTGIAIGAILFAIMLLKKGTTIINTDSYTHIEKLEQKVGRLKQRGSGNKMDVDISQEIPSKKELRKLKREEKRKNNAK